VSQQGDVLDRLVVHARTALGLPGGDPRAEREVRTAESLNPSEWPHAFVHSPASNANRLDHGQVEKILTATVTLLTRADTQEQLLAKLDGFEAALDGDRTLAGTVRSSFVSTTALFEFPGDPRKQLDLEVETRRIL